MPDQDRAAVGKPERLKLRRDYLAAAKGDRRHTRGFTLQAGAGRGAGRASRFGFTVTKKVGSAVERNRIRRRLREIVRLMGEDPTRSGRDFVLFATREALGAPFEELAKDLRNAISSLHVGARPRGNAGQAPSLVDRAAHAHSKT